MITRAEGILGEQIAIEYLKQQGYSILERNYTEKSGEIDIISRIKNVIVFVEVKRRTGNKYGNGLESVTPEKISRIIKTAELYLLRKKMSDCLCRFDILIVGADEVKEHIKNAFTKQDAGRKKHW